MIVRLMPHEVTDLEPVLAMLGRQKATDFEVGETILSRFISHQYINSLSVAYIACMLGLLCCGAKNTLQF